MKQNNSQIVKEYEAAREAVYSGEILGSEDFEILKEHIGGGAGRRGGYSPDFWTVIGFLMGRKSQESTSSFFDALALDPQPLEDPEQEIERIYCDMFHEGLYRAQNRKMCLEPYRSEILKQIGCKERSGGDLLVTGFLIGCAMMEDVLQKLDELEAETKGASGNAKKQ